MPPIEHLQRVPKLALDRLERQGLFTTGLFLEVSETPTRRITLADQVGVTTNDVNAWRDEALLLKCYDSDPARACFTAHTAIDDPGSPRMARILARIGSNAAVAEAASSITSTSNTTAPFHLTK